MPTFRYQAIDAKGHKVGGDLDAASVQQAVAQLETQGLSVQAISNVTANVATAFPETPAGKAPINEPPSTRVQPLSGESVEQAVLRSHMATILERGRLIAPALEAYAEEQPAGRERQQLLGICRVLRQGDASDAAIALAEMPEFWIPLLGAASSSADPGQVLHEFLTESRRAENLRRQWWQTLAYPIVLFCMVLVVMTLLSILVIPGFRQIFQEFDLQLPTITDVVLKIADWLSSWGMVLITLLLVGLAILVLNANRVLPPSTFTWLTSRVRLPFGSRTAVARFARFTADLLEAGISMPNALRIAGFAVHKSRLQQAAWRLANDLELTGQFSQRAYQRSLTSTIVYGLATPMSPAARVRLLREISTCHAERTRVGLSWTTGFVEPVAIAMVGFTVGMTVLALFIPLVKLVEGLSS